MNEKKDKTTNGNSWIIRRRIIVLTLLYSAVSVSYLILFGEDSRLNQDIASSLILLCASLIGSYVFGAIWDDGKK